ncbi:peptidase T4, partial [Escherichia coli]|nr:peptidase T4 [Escherichia coli]
GLGMGAHDPAARPRTKHGPGANTTIAIIATDAALSQAQATRLAVAAHDGMARAIVPSHTPLDGDLIFAAATGARALPDPVVDALDLGHAAATCLARAIARGVHAARPAPGDPFPTWGDTFG